MPRLAVPIGRGSRTPIPWHPVCHGCGHVDRSLTFSEAQLETTEELPCDRDSEWRCPSCGDPFCSIEEMPEELDSVYRTPPYAWLRRVMGRIRGSRFEGQVLR
jgi:hypothetical protein